VKKKFDPKLLIFEALIPLLQFSALGGAISFTNAYCAEILPRHGEEDTKCRAQ
jgi:hypothetical protein